MSPPLQLPVQVICPASPPWLVSKFVVAAGYVAGGQTLSAGKGEFDHKGGTLQGQVTPNDQGKFPDKVTVSFTVDYTPESGLPSLAPEPVEVAVTSAGARYAIQLPNRRLAEVEVRFDFPHGVLEGDFLNVRLAYLLGGKAVTARPKFLDYASLLPGKPHPATPILTGFILDPAPKETEKVRLEIKGRYFKKTLADFKADLDFDLPQMVILAQIKDDAGGPGFHVELP
jgi:hypothetical protein